MNPYSPGGLTKVVSAKITNNEYSLLQTIAKDYFSRYHVIKHPTITEIVRYLIRSCINANFPPRQTQVQGTTNSLQVLHMMISFVIVENMALKRQENGV